MKKFILIDHSLRDLGGHYYMYACSVLPAAERAGFKPVLVTHRDFHEFSALPPSWQAFAIFPHKSFSLRTAEGAAPRGAHQVRSTLEKLRWRLNAGKRARIARSFIAACAEVFSRVALEAGDHVLFATASEFDLEALATFLQSRPADDGVRWHLQFHTSLFHGRDPDYAAQEAAREQMSAVFRNALRRIPNHSVHCYCTTEQLTQQYQRLNVGRFDTLPYPIHPVFQQQAFRESSTEPIRIACLGHSRREKGYKQLPELVKELWKNYLRDGKAQLIVQTRRSDLRRALDREVDKLGAHSTTAPVEYAPFPLELNRYAELVHSTDVGLLLYDSARYYVRCSGVLLEMLASGVPVIVPAGSWLAEQIAEENQRHLERIAAEPGAHTLIAPDQIEWTTGIRLGQLPSAKQIVIEGGAVQCEFAVPVGTTALLVRFHWLKPATPGTYLHVAHASGGSGRETPPDVAITGQRSSQQPIHIMFPTNGADRVRLQLRNAWDRGPIALGNIEILALSGDLRPAGAIGLIAASVEQTSELLRDILLHVDHYRRHTRDFARRWVEEHSGERVIAQLTA